MKLPGGQRDKPYTAPRAEQAVPLSRPRGPTRLWLNTWFGSGIAVREPKEVPYSAPDRANKRTPKSRRPMTIHMRAVFPLYTGAGHNRKLHVKVWSYNDIATRALQQVHRGDQVLVAGPMFSEFYSEVLCEKLGIPAGLKFIGVVAKQLYVIPTEIRRYQTRETVPIRKDELMRLREIERNAGVGILQQPKEALEAMWKALGAMELTDEELAATKDAEALAAGLRLAQPGTLM